MARIRSLKPELPDDEILGSVSRDARLLFILLFTRCDDYGRSRAAGPYLRGQLFPYDDDATPAMVTGWLAELSDAGRVDVYEVDGQTYLEIVNWSKHQRIDNAGKALCPPNPASLGDSPQPAEFRGGSPLDHDHDHDPEGTTTDDPPRAAASLGESPQFWDEVWDTYAAKVTRTQKSVKNPAAYQRRIRRAAPHEHADRARKLLGEFELTARSLGLVLAGEESILFTTKRRTA